MTAEAQKEGSQYTKINFANNEAPPITSTEGLSKSLETYKMVPEGSMILGKPGETGIVVLSPQGEIVATARHPWFIPSSYDFATRKSEFYGQQNLAHLDTSMALTLEPEYSRQKAAEIVRSVKENGISQTSKETGCFTIGMEEECLHFDKDGNPKALPVDQQIELQDNVKEIPLDPTNGVASEALIVAESRLSEIAEHSDSTINSTSFSILGKPDEQGMNSSSDYIHAVAGHMFENYFFPKDSVAAQYWNNIAKEAGFTNFYDMRDHVKDLTPLTFVASHVSLGLRTEKTNGSYNIGLEEGIAVSDMFNSNFATVAEWMTYSTPLAFGNRPGVIINGEKRYPKDARAVGRLGSRTSHAGDFIYTPENYKSRAIEAIINGSADRIDRAAYTSYHEDLDQDIASVHARVRFRVTGGSGEDYFQKPLGRVEFVGGAATPDIVALVARNAMVKLMGIAAYEAVSNGQHPADYFKYKFPSMAACDEHIDLAHDYNFYGADHPKVAALLEEAKSFLNYIRQEYNTEEIQYLADLAEVGLNKLEEPTKARSLDEYLEDPQGNISDVVAHMWEDGYSAKEIAEAVAEFEKQQSEKIIENNGDILKMLEK
ncbi:hypothetical protein GF362_01580 [Candidatus Dojkabacteria bacterium]|nr:hypothetical protein [Candidatus Dojkabacteria bacterium]